MLSAALPTHRLRSTRQESWPQGMGTGSVALFQATSGDEHSEGWDLHFASLLCGLPAEGEDRGLGRSGVFVGIQDTGMVTWY